MAEVSEHPQQALGETKLRNLDELGSPEFDCKKKKNIYNGAFHWNQSRNQRFFVQSGTLLETIPFVGVNAFDPCPNLQPSNNLEYLVMFLFTPSGSGATSPDQSPKFQSHKNNWSNMVELDHSPQRDGETGCAQTQAQLYTKPFQLRTS